MPRKRAIADGSKASEVGARLRWARDEKGLKQCYVAARCGMHCARVNHVETKPVRPYWDEVTRLALVLGISFQWLSQGGNIDPWLPGRHPHEEK